MVGRAEPVDSGHVPAPPILLGDPLNIRQKKRSLWQARSLLSNRRQGLHWHEAECWTQRYGVWLSRVKRLHPGLDLSNDVIQSSAFCLESVACELKKQVEEYNKGADAASLQDWRERMKDSSKACKYLTCRPFLRLNCVEDASRHILSKPEDIDLLRIDFWTKASECDRDIGKLRKDFGKEWVSKYVAMQAQHDQPVFTVQQIQEALKIFKTGVASEPHGWAVTDLRQLSKEAWQEMVVLMDMCVRLEVVPNSWLLAVVTMIPKGGKFQVQHQRPISVLPLLWRLFGKLLLAGVRERTEHCLHERQCGGRRQHSTTDVLDAVRAQMDNAHRRAMPLWVLQLDLTKAFNSLDVNVALDIAEKAGVCLSTVRMLRYIYGHLSLRHRLPFSRLGSSWRPARGILQGDCLGPILCNLVISVLTRAVDDGLSDGQAYAYLDDITLVSTSWREFHTMVESK